MDDRAQTSFRLPRELVDELQKAARARMVSTNVLVTRLLEEGLAELIPADEVRLTRRG